MISTRPLEHSGLTKLELDIVDCFHKEIDFDFACGFGFQNEYGNKLQSAGIRCIDLAPKGQLLSYMKSIYQVVKSNNYDSVYIHGNSSMMILEALPSKMAGARVITHCHNSRPPRASIHYFVVKPFFNMLVDCKIGCSRKASEWAYCGKNIRTILNGIDTNQFYYNPVMRKSIRDEFDWVDSVVVGHIGAFNEQKNHSKLIDVFSEFVKRVPNARLLLIGTGELKNEVCKKIELLNLSDRVTLLDHVYNPYDYYQAMDIFIMPSLFEGLSLAALEAQSCGVPFLASDVMSDEVAVTPVYQTMSLSSSASEWADVAVSMLDNEREDMSSYFIEHNLDCKSMMKSILNCMLLENDKRE